MDFANDRGGLIKLSRNQDIMAAVSTRDMYLRAGFIILEKLEWI